MPITVKTTFLNSITMYVCFDGKVVGSSPILVPGTIMVPGDFIAPSYSLK